MDSNINLTRVAANSIISPNSNVGGVCVKGSIVLRSDVKVPYWVVSWPHQGKVYKITKYPGEKEPMYQRHPKKDHDIGYKKAEKLRALMQGDEERGIFRIEKFIGEHLTDIIPYLENWLEDRRPNLTPGGYIKYRTAVRNYLIPFFKEHPVMLHEIRYDTLVRLLNWVKGSGKHKKNVVDTLRCCLRYAWKSERILAIPPFPEKHLYDIRSKPPIWLPSDRYQAVISQLQDEHKPFFMWLYLHLRRPGEAMALRKEDYDAEQDVFIIRRGVSNGEVIERTKTGDIHLIPCAEEFKPYMESMPKTFGPYFFTCSESKSDGKRYTGKLYRRYWKEACEKAGEDIDVYRGTKTSRASQMINEDGMSMHDLQIAGDWASLSSVESYAKANIAKKRSLIDRKVIQLTGQSRGNTSDKNVK
ncbi:MAG: tyrosine-type recombinase/integrase [Desulfomonilia bacterium]